VYPLLLHILRVLVYKQASFKKSMTKPGFQGLRFYSLKAYIQHPPGFPMGGVMHGGIVPDAAKSRPFRGPYILKGHG